MLVVRPAQDRDRQSVGGEQGEGEPPGVDDRGGHLTVAGPAQGVAHQAAQLVVDGEVPAQVALDTGGFVQPLAQAAVADERLDHPLDATGHQARREGAPEPPVPYRHREHEQRQRDPDGVGGPHPGHQRGARQDAPQGPSVEAVHAGPQEAGDADQGAERDPEVGHGLRTVEEGHPQGGEQSCRAGQYAGREQAAPGAQGQVQAESGQDGEIDTQQGRGRRPGGDGPHQQRDATRAWCAEEGGRSVGADLADVHHLVPAEADRGPHEEELGEREGAGHRREQAVATRLPRPAGHERLVAPSHAHDHGLRAVGHRPPLPLRA